MLDCLQIGVILLQYIASGGDLTPLIAVLQQTELLEWAVAHGRMMVASHVNFSGAFVSSKSV
jgi:hypothetical protein